jgi:hypothetical protein
VTGGRRWRARAELRPTIMAVRGGTDACTSTSRSGRARLHRGSCWRRLPARCGVYHHPHGSAVEVAVIDGRPANGLSSAGGRCPSGADNGGLRARPSKIESPWRELASLPGYSSDFRAHTRRACWLGREPPIRVGTGREVCSKAWRASLVLSSYIPTGWSRLGRCLVAEWRASHHQRNPEPTIDRRSRRILNRHEGRLRRSERRLYCCNSSVERFMLPEAYHTEPCRSKRRVRFRIAPLISL